MGAWICHDWGLFTVKSYDKTNILTLAKILQDSPKYRNLALLCESTDLILFVSENYSSL